MEREILKQLLTWKTASNRKPLLLYGARQVGKTHTLNTFAKQAYRAHIYLNFENNPILKQYFEGSLEPKELIYKLSIHFNQSIEPEHTLIIFDEVQECPHALNSLKYFHERANEYHVCACGSLLGVKIGHKEGFPVGQVNFYHLYPLSFMEFLDAIGERRLKDHLISISKIEPLPEPFHNKLNELLRIYYFTGGMPEAVRTYIQTKDFNAVRDVHRDILKSYELDFAKHATKTLSMKISEVWHAIPNQLAKENKKFVYSLVRSSARAREYEEAIQWLHAAGLIHKIYNVSTPKMPLNAYANWNNFKVYLLDVGLLNTLAELPVQALLTGNQLFQEFKGSLTENFVFQTLALNFDKQYYWTSQGTAEVDGVIQLENAIFPLEIKANISTKSRSLQSFVTKYQPTLSIRTSMLNLRLDGKTLNIPLYLLAYLDQLAKSTRGTA
jgi:uncharacterized protein